MTEPASGRHRYFVLYKPYCMISQFVSPYEQTLLADLPYNFPEGTHAVGRLDFHSEGLLILTTDKSVTRKIYSEGPGHTRLYHVLVEHKVSEDSLQKLRQGVMIGVKGKGFRTTDPCDVRILAVPPQLPEREPPYVMHCEHTWLEFRLQQGLNRQIRKMCAAVRHKCKRLVRYSIEDLDIAGMKSGELRELQQADFFRLLKIDQ